MKKTMYLCRAVLNMTKELCAQTGDHVTFDFNTNTLSIFRHNTLVGSTTNVSSTSFKTMVEQGWLHAAGTAIQVEEDEGDYEELIAPETPVVEPKPQAPKHIMQPLVDADIDEEELIEADGGSDIEEGTHLIKGGIAVEVAPVLKPNPKIKPEPSPSRVVEINTSEEGDELVTFDDSPEVEGLDTLGKDYEVAPPIKAIVSRDTLSDGGEDEVIPADEDLSISPNGAAIVSKPASQRKISKVPRIKR